MPKRILLADDSITIQKVVELTFSDGDYEVTAVNNGAKAIQKLGEMRPDIILSDIIMPEKNGYEVCEYVKSHPEYRTIPVVLLTGTFEPFDPDRAEKAGCDAVVTKPFESQSLIHKVEELVAQAQGSAAPAAVPAAPEATAEPEAEPSPWLEEPAPSPEPAAFTTSSGSFPATPEPESPEPFTHDADIFGAVPSAPEMTAMPFEAPPELPPVEHSSVDFAGETRALPRTTFDEEPQAPLMQPPSAHEPLPWDEPAVTDHSFDRTEVADLESMQEPLESEPASMQDESESPFGAPPPAADFSAETRAFQKMSFEELQQAAPHVEPEPEPVPAAEAEAPPSSPWEEPAETPLFEGEAPSFPPLSYEPQPEPEQVAAQPVSETSPWDEQPEPLPGETQTFPAMTFDQLAAMAPPAEETAPQAEAAPEPEGAPLTWDEPAAPAWAPAEEEPAAETLTPESFSTAAYAPFVPPEEPAAEQPAEEAWPMPEEQPAQEMAAEAEETLIVPPPPVEPEWAPAAAAEAAAEPEEPAIAPAALAPETPAIPIRASDLSEEQIDRIARRVVELMSDQLVRNIAWEVIPDLAEMVVKERIRQLESEA